MALYKYVYDYDYDMMIIPNCTAVHRHLAKMGVLWQSSILLR